MFAQNTANHLVYKQIASNVTRIGLTLGFENKS